MQKMKLLLGITNYYRIQKITFVCLVVSIIFMGVACGQKKSEHITASDVTDARMAGWNTTVKSRFFNNRLYIDVYFAGDIVDPADWVNTLDDILVETKPIYYLEDGEDVYPILGRDIGVGLFSSNGEPLHISLLRQPHDTILATTHSAGGETAVATYVYELPANEDWPMLIHIMHHPTGKSLMWLLPAPDINQATLLEES